LKTFLLSSILFLLFYFTLRYLKSYWEKQLLPKWSKYFLGVFAWAALAGLIGIVWGLLQPVIELFTAPTYGVAIILVGYAFCIMIVTKLTQGNPEVFDIASMWPFLKASLAFSNPARTRMLLSEELEKNKVKQIYKEATGKELKTNNYDLELKKKLMAVKKDVLWAQDKRVKSSQELLAELKKPIQSIHASEELKQLQGGSSVDITDTWILNRQKKSSHPFFHLVKHVTVDPSSAKIIFVLESEQFTDEKVRDQATLYRLKQDLYEFLQGVHQQDWVQPYLPYVSLISCECCYVEDLLFSGIKVHPVCRVEMSRAQLKAYENMPYDVSKMSIQVLV
jgi:hypothetical protein